MIDRIRIRNFRCLREVDMALGPLNFLIGSNNTGKSSLLDALSLLSDCLGSQDTNEAFCTTDAAGVHVIRQFDRLVPKGDTRLDIEYVCEIRKRPTVPGYAWGRYGLAIGLPLPGVDVVCPKAESVEAGGDPSSVDLAVRRKGRGSGEYEETFAGSSSVGQVEPGKSTLLMCARYAADTRFHGITHALRSVSKFRLTPSRIAEPCQVDREAGLSHDGFGMATCLDNLADLHPERFAKIQDALRKFVPGVRNVTFPTVERGKKCILFHEDWGGKIYASEASDGLLLFLAYLAIAYADGERSLVLVEEPETGVHPNRLRDIVRLLRAMSRGELGLPPVQVIATSHSPYLLDWCSKEELVLFLRGEDGDVRTKPVAEIPDIDERIEDFASLGEFVYTVGEGLCKSLS